MKTFFTSLESELSDSKTVYSQEEIKEALAKVKEALNRTPTHYYYWLKNSAINIKAFKILASFYCSSTTLTSKQKNVLSAMEESLQELGDRAVKAKRDKDNLTEKESIKLTLTHNLDRNLIRYKEVESEAKQIERNLVALHEQVEEAHKKRENRLSERKGIFRSSMKMKEELEALGKEWAEYEAKAEVAEKEEKTVMAEWTRMKDFISCIKRKI
ncbi:hypothetical protein HRI_002422700 [Hibiscus trionum]|uniref:Uncharacterized protein n=1 Tax=Hibiscus trionum TaxID=183268 RepID=A0A9W7I1D8_HIBTR|nr:hypothetical protein HRI_002422700 [Hibiscus trionum]